MKTPQLVKPLGGLSTKSPPVSLDPASSPDCLNVVVRDGAVRSRGGFVPKFRDRLMGDAIKTAAWRTTGRVTPGATSDIDYIIQPGWMVAGHRSVYEDQTALRMSFWVKFDELPGQHGGNGQDNVSATIRTSPYTVRVLPIISKGPVKRSIDTSGGWSSTASTAWGAGASDGMPFCVYLYNAGTGTLPSWQLTVAAHVLVAGTWTLQSVVSAQSIEVGVPYHVLASVSGSGLAIRVKKGGGGYTEQTVAFTGTLATNKCPIQVFDCPQMFVEGPAVGTASNRPGLDLTVANLSGGWWFAKVRPEATIDDIAIWGGSGSLSALESATKVRGGDQTDLLNHWSFTSLTGMDYVRDEAGRGNHLYLVPRGPVEAPDGGKEGGGWFFNGTTSHALLDTQTPSWRLSGYSATVTATGTSTSSTALTLVDSSAPFVAGAHIGQYVVAGGSVGVVSGNTTTTLTVTGWRGGTPPGVGAYTVESRAYDLGAMEALVKNNKAHGIAVEFWVDSIEPAFEQVIAEVHGVLRLAISSAGKLVGYCRSGGAAAVPTTANEIGLNYQGPITSNITLQPGRRYSALLLREDGGTSMALYVDGALDVSLGALTACNTLSFPPGGITIGMGSYERMTRGLFANDSAIPASNLINTDARSGFVGVVETFRIVCSTGYVIKRHGPESETDWKYPESQLMSNNVVASPKVLNPADVEDLLRYVGGGALARASTQYLSGTRFSHAISVSGTGYTLFTNMLTTDHASGRLGHNVALSAVGVSVYHHLCYYRFSTKDRDGQYCGAYNASGAELRYSSSTFVMSTLSTMVHAAHPTKAVHVQYSEATDELGNLGVAQRRCAEADVIDETTNAMFVTDVGWITSRQRPYGFRSPRELGPKWSEGIALPLSGTAKVSLITDYEVQEAGRRVIVVGVGRRLYWAKPAWDDGHVFFAGGADSHILALTNAAADCNAVGTATKTVVEASAWVKPLRLDGLRPLMVKWTPGTSSSDINWAVFVDNGAIVVMGVESGGRVWKFVEGYAPAGATAVRQTSSLRVGSWNHVLVTVGATGVRALVNGQQLALVDCSTLTGAAQTSAFGAAASATPTGELYIGGAGVSGRVYVLNAVGDPLSLYPEAWFGSIADVSIRLSSDTTRYPAGKSGFPPPMFTEDASAAYAWPMDEGEGWLLANRAAASYPAEIRIKEYYLIADDIEQEEDRFFRSVAYRDSLIVTNGAHYPLQVRFNGFMRSSMFDVRRLGIPAPVTHGTSLTQSTTAGTAIPIGTYLVYCSFLNDEGHESDAVLLGSVTTASAFGSLDILISNLPRSPDSQVVSRKLYVSPIGGGAAIENRDIFDNDGTTCTVTVYAGFGVDASNGSRLEAPRARHIAVAGSSLVMADLPEEPAGQNAFAFSVPGDIESFTSTSTVVIDSEDGKPLVGISHNMAQVFLSKADSIHQLAVGSIVTAEEVEAAMRLVQSSDGVGAGAAGANNLIFGAGDRGVFSFDNTSLGYLSNMIEPTWRDQVDRSDSGLYRMAGVYWRRYSTYWLSVRRKGEDDNDTILMLDIASGQWTPSRVVPHSCVALLDDSESPEVVIGTTDGMILAYRENVSADGLDLDDNVYGAITTAGTSGLSGSSTSLTHSTANFPTALGGLCGVTATIVCNAGTFTRRISSNTLQTIRWDEPIPGWSSFTTYVIGEIDAYWTSPWFAGSGLPGRQQRLVDVPIELLAMDGNLRVDIASLAINERPETAFPATMETFQVPMETGFAQRSPQPRRHSLGTYHRVRFGTRGVGIPFAVVGYGVELEPATTRDQAGRTS